MIVKNPTLSERQALRINNSVLEETRSLKAYRPIEKISEHQLTIGKRVGSGGFSTVRAVSLPGTHNDSTNALYVIKRLRDDLEEKKLIAGTKDLLIEANLLSSLNHPNIIQLKACAVLNAITDLTKPQNFFLILDKLNFTLTQLISQWQKDKANHIHTPHVFNTKISILKRVTNAMAFLHSNNIIHRDLKPDNIGFDRNGEVKVFDLGIGRVLINGKRKGLAGTWRYMAPEVIKGESYNAAIDTYSLAMVAFHTLTLIKPFENYTKEGHARTIVNQPIRPPKSKLPKSMKLLVTSAWDQTPELRPSMAAFNLLLGSLGSKGKKIKI